MSFKATNVIFVYGVILMVFFVLGCTGSGSAGASDRGVVITDFSFDTSSVYSGDPAYLMLELENQGQKKVTGDTHVFIYGHEFDDVRQWRWVTGGIVTSPPGVTTGTSTESSRSWKIPNDEFLPPDPEMGISGGVALIDAQLTAPELESGESSPYTFYARACYPYETSMLSTVTSISREEMRVVQDTSKAEAINTAGPIHISLAGNSNVISRSGQSIPIVFQVTDVGGGFSTLPGLGCTSVPGSTDRGKVHIAVQIDGLAVPGDACPARDLKLRDGLATMRCSIPIDPNVDPTREYHIRAIVDYNYYVTSDTAITVDYIEPTA